jgi:hypothetical protein
MHLIIKHVLINKIKYKVKFLKIFKNVLIIIYEFKKSGWTSFYFPFFFFEYIKITCKKRRNLKKERKSSFNECLGDNRQRQRNDH